MSYRIEDEPRPGGLAHLAVRPLWPLFVVMFGGALWSWTWFVVNAFAIGSPTRRREIAWAIGGLVGNVVLVAGVFALIDQGVIEVLGARYALVGVTVWKLAVSYRLVLLQSRTFDLFEHYGGKVRNGMAVVFLAWFATDKLVKLLPTFWIVVLR